MKEAVKGLTSSQHKALTKSMAPAFEHAISGMLDEVSAGVPSYVRVLADKSVKWQGLKAVDTFHTRFFSASIMHYVGEVTKDFKDIQRGDQAFITFVKDFGFNETDFQILSMVERKGGMYITVDGIRNINNQSLESFAKTTGKSADQLKDTLASKFNTMIWGLTQEQVRGSQHSSLQDTKYLSSRGGNPLFRFTSQFLITPLSILRQHLWTVPHHHIEDFVSAQWYRAKFLAIGIVLENVVTQALQKFLIGEEQPDYTDPKHYADLVLKALTHYDRFSSPYNTPDEGLAKGIVGPAISNIAELGIAGFKWVQADPEKPQRVERKRDTFTKRLSSQIPLQRLWQVRYAQNVFQYNVLDNIFDILNPGYKERDEMQKENIK